MREQVQSVAATHLLCCTRPAPHSAANGGFKLLAGPMPSVRLRCHRGPKRPAPHLLVPLRCCWVWLRLTCGWRCALYATTASPWACPSGCVPQSVVVAAAAAVAASATQSAACKSRGGQCCGCCTACTQTAVQPRLQTCHQTCCPTCPCRHVPLSRCQRAVCQAWRPPLPLLGLFTSSTTRPPACATPVGAWARTRCTRVGSSASGCHAAHGLLLVQARRCCPACSRWPQINFVECFLPTALLHASHELTVRLHLRLQLRGPRPRGAGAAGAAPAGPPATGAL